MSDTQIVRDQVRDIWAELLHKDPTQIPDDRSFLRLGGDSVLSVRLSALIRQRLGVTLALSDVRVDTTVDELTAVVEQRAVEGPGAASAAIPSIVSRRADPGEPFPLLPLQQGYFVGQQDGWELSYESAHYYVDYGLVDVEDGDEAAEAIVDAIERLAMHQPTLRARTTPDGHQRVLDATDPEAVPPVHIHDLRQDSDAEASLNALREKLSTQGPDPQRGPGLDLHLTLMPDNKARVHLGLSLLIFDGWSTTLLNRELLIFAANWNAVVPPLEVDFGEYVTALADLPSTPGYIRDRQWWFEQLDTLPRPPALPLVCDPRDTRAQIMGNREFRLDAKQWRLVRDQCREHGVTPSAAMLAAFGVVLADWAGHRDQLITSLQLNRLPIHPDVQRVVGAFASTMFVPLRLEQGATFAELARHAQTVSADSAAHNLITGVEVGRELARRRGSRRPQGPVVFQSVLGMDNALGDVGPVDAGPLGTMVPTDYYHQLRTPQVALEVRCFELHDQMAGVFSLVEELFDTTAVDAAFARFERIVRDLVHPERWQDVPGLPDRASPDPQAEGLRLGLLPETEVEASAGPLAAELDHAVAELFEDQLEVPVLDRGAHFFDLGGDSLLAVRVVAHIARQFGVRLALREFLDAPTVAGVVRAIESRKETA
ncbi:MAG: phosphopantetheine-binding protein [Myxococcota bacterium]